MSVADKSLLKINKFHNEYETENKILKEEEATRSKRVLSVKKVNNLSEINKTIENNKIAISLDNNFYNEKVVKQREKPNKTIMQNNHASFEDDNFSTLIKSCLTVFFSELCNLNYFSHFFLIKEKSFYTLYSSIIITQILSMFIYIGLGVFLNTFLPSFYLMSY